MGLCKFLSIYQVIGTAEAEAIDGSKAKVRAHNIAEV